MLKLKIVKVKTMTLTVTMMNEGRNIIIFDNIKMILTTY